MFSCFRFTVHITVFGACGNDVGVAYCLAIRCCEGFERCAVRGRRGRGQMIGKKRVELVRFGLEIGAFFLPHLTLFTQDGHQYVLALCFAVPFLEFNSFATIQVYSYFVVCFAGECLRSMLCDIPRGCRLYIVLRSFSE